MLDCDPNQSLSLWANQGTLPKGIKVIGDITESSVVKTIKQHDVDGSVVVVDLEGVASLLVSRAISQADLVITPMRATTLDAKIGARSLELIALEEETLGRSIPSTVVFTMTRAIRSKQHSQIEQSLRSQGVDIIDPPLMERAAYSALFAFGGDLRTIPAQGNMDSAQENAALFAQAVFQRLTRDGSVAA